MRRPVPWLAALAALALYWATVARGVGWDDAGELAAGVTRLGVVHQTGYPVYLLLGKAFTALVPFGSAALHANLWSGVAAAAAAGLVARYVLVATGSVVGALLAAALLALGPVTWYQATVASVYPLFLVAVALLLTAADAWQRRPSAGRLALVAAAAGLAAVSHKSGLAFAAAALGFVVLRARRDVLRPRNLAALAAVLVPLATVLYLPLREHYAGFPNLRAQAHAGVLGWATGSVGAPDADPLAGNLYALRLHAGRLALLLVASLSPALVLAPFGAWRLRTRGAFVWCCLAPAVVVSAVAATTPGGYAYWHLPLVLALAIATGAGAAAAIERARRTRAAAMALALALVACVGFTALAGAGYLSDSHRSGTRWARATLAAAPPQGRIVAPWASYTALAATQELEGRRRDVRVTVASEPPVAPRGYEFRPIGPAARANVKGISGLRLGSLRVGLPRARARARAYVLARAGP